MRMDLVKSRCAAGLGLWMSSGHVRPACCWRLVGSGSGALLIHWQPLCFSCSDEYHASLSAFRYQTYDELYDYCYRVAGTVALMSVPVMGVDKAYKVRACCICLVWAACMASHATLIGLATGFDP